MARYTDFKLNAPWYRKVGARAGHVIPVRRSDLHSRAAVGGIVAVPPVSRFSRGRKIASNNSRRLHTLAVLLTKLISAKHPNQMHSKNKIQPRPIENVRVLREKRLSAQKTNYIFFVVHLSTVGARAVKCESP